MPLHRPDDRTAGNRSLQEGGEPRGALPSQTVLGHGPMGRIAPYPKNKKKSRNFFPSLFFRIRRNNNFPLSLSLLYTSSRSAQLFLFSRDARRTEETHEAQTFHVSPPPIPGFFLFFCVAPRPLHFFIYMSFPIKPKKKGKTNRKVLVSLAHYARLSPRKKKPAPRAAFNFTTSYRRQFLFSDVVIFFFWSTQPSSPRSKHK